MAAAERDDDEQQGGGVVPSDSPAPEGEPKRVTIDLAEADEEESEAGQQQKQTELKPIRHKSQWRQMKEAHAKTEQELREKIAALEGRLSAPREREVVRESAPPTKREETSDPREREVQQIWRMQQRTLAAIRSGQYPDSDVREMEDDWRQMDRRRRSLENAIDNGQSQQPQQQSFSQADIDRYMLRSNFPQIFAKESLRKQADAEMELLKEQGWPDDISTAREACERVYNRRGIGRKAPAPTPAEKARHAGVPGRAGATAGAGDPDKYTPTKYIMDLAKAYTQDKPDMTDEDRYKHWRRYVGKPNGLVP